MGKTYKHNKVHGKAKEKKESIGESIKSSNEGENVNELSNSLAQLNINSKSKEQKLDFNRREVNFREINRQIKRFIREETEETFDLDPCRPELRALIHQLSHMYKLDSYSSGEGESRFCTLKKNNFTYIPTDFRKIDSFIIYAQKRASHLTGPRREKGSKGRGGTAPSQQSTRLASGAVVGHNSNPIGDDNVGKTLLCKIGWAPGNGLGPDGKGHTEPISAVYKKDRKGLGS